MHLIPITFAQWAQQTWLARTIEASMWGFAIIETIHIMGLAVLLGAIFVVDLRLLGVGSGRGFQGASELAESLNWWTAGGLAVMIVTGICLYSSEALRLMLNRPFSLKLLLVTFAIVFHFTVHRRALRRSADGSRSAKRAAYISMASWFSVALAGRAIAFVS